MSNHTLCLSVCLSSCLPVFPSPAGSHRPIAARLDGGQGSKPGIFAHFHGKLQLSGGQHPEHCPQLRGEATPAQPRASSQSSSHQSHQLAFRLASSHSVPGVCAGSVVEEREMHPLHLKPLWRSWKDLNALPKKQPPRADPLGCPCSLGRACSQAGESSLEPGAGLCRVWGSRYPSHILTHIPGQRQSPGTLLVCPHSAFSIGKTMRNVPAHPSLTV